jgi:hypothetical protein
VLTEQGANGGVEVLPTTPHGVSLTELFDGRL